MITTTTTPATNAIIGTLEKQVEMHLQQVLANFQNQNSETLLKPAANGGWSIAQCIDHLNTYGRYYLPLIAEKLKNPAPYRKPFKSGWLGGYFVRMMQQPASQKPLKAVKKHLPAPKLDAHAVVAEFIQQQEQLLALLRQAQNTDLNGARLPISILKLIKLKIGDILLFLVAHNQRHLLQAQRNLPTVEG